MSENPICCSNCIHLEITGAYGECRKRPRLVLPDDTCERAEKRTDFERCEDCVYQKVCRLKGRINNAEIYKCR